jgi:RimJ/RimL family protein N-acetyltransferase
MRVTLRPTRPADLAEVTHETLPIRIRAITAVIHDPAQNRERVLGIGGIGYRADGVVICFAALNDEFRHYRVAIHRAGLAMMRMIRSAGVNEVIATADTGIAPSARYLERLGFRPVGEGDNAILVDGHPLYVWTAQDRTSHG